MISSILRKNLQYTLATVSLAVIFSNQALGEDKPHYSNAFNFKNVSMQASVNAQTGMLTLRYPNLSIPGKHGLNLDLGIYYDQSNTSNQYGLGQYWSYDFSYFTPSAPGSANGTLHLAGGATYKADSSVASGLRYYTLKDLHFTFCNGGQALDKDPDKKYYYRIDHLDGSSEFLDKYGRLMEIENRFGDAILLAYANEQNKQFSSITDTYGQQITFDNSSQSIVVRSGETPLITYQLNARLSNIVDAKNRVIHFDYNDDGSISQVAYNATGARTIVKYDPTTEIHATASDGQPVSLKTVSSLTQCANSQCTNPTLTTYRYEDASNPTNYTGYNKNEQLTHKLSTDNDALLQDNSATSYVYQTTITHDGVSKINTYNHLHLLIKQETKANNGSGSSPTVEVANYSYPATTTYADLPANYQKPTAVQTDFYTLDGKSTSPRSRTIETSYNNFGQLIEKKTFAGSDNGTTPAIDEIIQYDNPSDDLTIGSDSNHYGLTLSDEVKTSDNADKLTVNTPTADHKNIATQTQKMKSRSDTSLQTVKVINYTYWDASSKDAGRLKSKTISAGSGNDSASNSYTYNDNAEGGGRSVTTTDALGHTQTKIYDKLRGKLIESIDGKGNKLYYINDALGRVTEVDSQSKGHALKYISYHDDPAGENNSVTETDALSGFKTITLMDGLGRKTQVQNNAFGQESNGESNFVASYRYDDNGHVLEKKVGYGDNPSSDNSIKTTYWYDVLGRLTTTTDDNGVKHYSIYNRVKNTKDSYYRSADLNDKTDYLYTTKSYNNLDQQTGLSLTSNQDNAEITTSANYGNFNQLINKTDNLQTQVYTYDYSASGEVDTVVSSANTAENGNDDAVKISSHYDPLFHKLTKKIVSSANNPDDSQSGNTFTYNKNGLVETQKNAHDQVETAHYDSNNNIKDKTNWEGDKFEYRYQLIAGKDRLTDIDVTPIASKKKYTLKHYDYYSDTDGNAANRGRLKDIYLLDDAGNKQQGSGVSYSYYNNGKVKSTCYQDADSTDLSACKAIQYRYNKDSSLQSRTDALGHVSYFSYYDDSNQGRGKLHSVTIYKANDKSSGDILSQVSYFYNKRGLVETKMRGNHASTDYTYDSLDRVHTMDLKDTAGNTLVKYTYIYNAHNQVITKTEESPSLFVSNGLVTTTNIYNNAGRLLSSTRSDGKKNEAHTYSYSIVGNILSGDQMRFDYNKLNQIKAINGKTTTINYDHNGNMHIDDQGNQYDYNVLGQMISFKKSDGAEYTYHYYADGNRASKSLKGGNRIQYYYAGDQDINEVASDGSAFYLLGNAREARIVTTPTGDSAHYYGCDKHGSVIFQSLGVDGTPIHYSPYGGIINQGAQASVATLSIEDNPFLYSSYYYDKESQLYYLTARYYNPRLMTFMQKDSYRFVNRYNYADGDVINRIDPDGHSSFGNLFKGIGHFFRNIFSSPVNVISFGASMLLGGAVGSYLVGGIADSIISGILGRVALNAGYQGTVDTIAAATLSGSIGGGVTASVMSPIVFTGKFVLHKLGVIKEKPNFQFAADVENGAIFGAVGGFIGGSLGALSKVIQVRRMRRALLSEDENFGVSDTVREYESAAASSTVSPVSDTNSIDAVYQGLHREGDTIVESPQISLSHSSNKPAELWNISERVGWPIWINHYPMPVEG